MDDLDRIPCVTDVELFSLCLKSSALLDKRASRGEIGVGTVKNYKSALTQFKKWASTNKYGFDEFYVLVREWEVRSRAIGDNVDNYKFVGRLVLSVHDMCSIISESD